MADVPIDCEFPVWGLLPKKETGVVSFANKYPHHDGRDTVIAILDSGVDPAASGLQLTSTGETKVIERFDCSGCGDVDTSTVITKLVDGTITGLTGRKLSIPPSWKNPKGEWRVGILYPYSIYPTKVKERIQEHRRLIVWDLGHKQAFSKANQDLQDFEKERSPSSILTPEEKVLKEELETRVEILLTAEKKFTDLGPTYDCVLFHDGEVWRACIDTSESGDLASGPFLGEYSITHEHSHLTPLDEMTISINVHNEGNILEIVGMCSTHGTHVASIASGYFPDTPALNGVSPGAKIISLTIGDSRLGSMETGTALIRACIKIMELSKTIKVDVINMSYGEHAHWSNSGRVGDIICEVVNNYGVTWIVSAGNHGPALCTVGAPPDISQSVLIGVGAFVSGDMSCAAYSLRTRLPSGAFTWSSRGPTCDGAAGVSVCAPGGAVASVARFTLRNAQLMNGTSMSAPHVAGVVSALISGLKANNIPFSPYSMKRALENSATYLNHVEAWAQGCGLVNIEKAFELLTQHYDVMERDVTFQLNCNNMKGILFRPKPDEQTCEFGVTIEPHFLYEKELRAETIEKQIKFGIRLALTCKDSWIQAPIHLDMTNSSRTISFKVNCNGLAPGAHYSEICAFDVNCIEKGPVFRIPITVLQHETIPLTPCTPKFSVTNAEFKQATIKRHFFMVPHEATWAVLKMNTEGNEKSYRFLIHTMQLLPKQSCRTRENQKLMSMSADASINMPFRVLGGVSLELVIAKYWTHIGEVNIDYSLEFRGVRPDFGQCMYFHGAEGVASCFITSLRKEDIVPSLQLKYCSPVLRPTDFKLSPLTNRDVIPPSRQIYQLINTYNFHIPKACDVSPMVSLLCDTLYESEVESQMWMMYNSAKQLVGIGDAYPSKYTVKVDKGEHCLKVQFRHENKQLLEKLTELCLILQQRLAQPINVDVYASLSQALTGVKKFTPMGLPGGHTVPVYFGAVAPEKTARSNISIGQLLSGTVSFAKDELGRKVDQYDIRYVVPEPPKKSNANNKDKDKGKNTLDEYSEGVRDYKIVWLAKVEAENLEKVYEELKQEFPDYMGVHIGYLNSADNPTDLKKLPRVNQAPDTTVEFCENIIKISDTILEKLNQDKVLAYLGLKTDLRTDAHKIKADYEKQKTFIIEALCHRGIALCRLQALGQNKEKELAQNLADLYKFADFLDPKTTSYGVWHCFTQKQWGRAIKLMNRQQEEKPSKEIEERLIEAYTQLGWDYFADYAVKAMPLKFPNTYRSF